MIRKSFLGLGCGVVNQALPSLNGGSNKITLTVPLILSNSKEHSINLIVFLMNFGEYEKKYILYTLVTVNFKHLNTKKND